MKQHQQELDAAALAILQAIIDKAPMVKDPENLKSLANAFALVADRLARVPNPDRERRVTIR